jgi:hypothetical protein
MTGRNRLLFMVKLRESFDNGMGIWTVNLILRSKTTNGKYHTRCTFMYLMSAVDFASNISKNICHIFFTLETQQILIWKLVCLYFSMIYMIVFIIWRNSDVQKFQLYYLIVEKKRIPK